MLVPQGYDLKALERIRHLGVFSHHVRNINSTFSNGEKYAPYMRDITHY
ncbi:MAG: hypothetical protein ACFWT6_03475 [Virgibacillus proomii]